MLDISISVLGFGGLFCLVWAAGLSLQLPIRTKFIAVYFVGISGFRLVWEAFTLSGFVYRYPEIYSLPVPFLYLIGHSILFYYEKLSGVENWKMSYSHFIPVVIAFLPLIIHPFYSGVIVLQYVLKLPAYRSLPLFLCEYCLLWFRLVLLFLSKSHSNYYLLF